MNLSLASYLESIEIVDVKLIETLGLRYIKFASILGILKIPIRNI